MKEESNLKTIVVDWYVWHHSWI